VPNLYLTPNWKATQKFTQEVVQTQLGDGYQQIASGGMIPELEEWELTKSGLNTTEVNEYIEQFSLASGVDNFHWQPPTHRSSDLWKERPYFCKMWSKTALGPDIWEFKCTLIRDWEPTS
jgi:phage-related protein